jgi:hypothetical protein
MRLPHIAKNRLKIGSGWLTEATEQLNQLRLLEFLNSWRVFLLSNQGNDLCLSTLLVQHTGQRSLLRMAELLQQSLSFSIYISVDPPIHALSMFLSLTSIVRPSPGEISDQS